MITTKICIIDYQAIKKCNFSIDHCHWQNHKKYNWEFFMNLTKLAATTLISLALVLTTSTVSSQEDNNTGEQNLDSVGENLKDAGRSLGNALENTGEAIERKYEEVESTASEAAETINQTAETAPTEIEETTTVIKEKSNWGWLGLVGLLGLFGLAGKKEVAVTHREPEISDRTTIRSR